MVQRLTSDYCDDDNHVNGDGCDASCKRETGYTCTGGDATHKDTCTPTCGDGLVKGSETCDDLNTVSNDGCSSTCQIELGYSCPTPGTPCTTVCGDGLVKGSETCDDHNILNNDG